MSSERVSLLSNEHGDRQVNYHDSDNDPFLLPTRTATRPQKKNKKMPTNEDNDDDLSYTFNSRHSQLHYSTNNGGDAVFYNTYQNSPPLYPETDDGNDSSPQSDPVRRINGKSQQPDQGKSAKDGKKVSNSTNPEINSFVVKSLSKYDMKNHMANERTFFKYLFTGLHIGSIGTLVLTFFPNEDINKLYLVMFIWLVAFAFMFWGLYGYYRRKNLMESGKMSDSNEISPHTPLLISSIFVGVLLLVVWYGLYVHYKYDSGLSLSKIFMMSEKQTTGRAGKKKNGRRRNGGSSGTRRRKREAAAANDADGQTVTPTKVPLEGQAGVDLVKNEPKDAKPQQEAAIIPDNDHTLKEAKIDKTVKINDNQQPTQQAGMVYSPAGKHARKDDIVIPQTNTAGGEIHVDGKNFGKNHNDDDVDEHEDASDDDESTDGQSEDETHH